MKNLEDVKKCEYKGIEKGWFDGDGNKITTDHFERIEEIEIDGIKYIYLMYMYGKGLVIANDTQRSTIKVSDLKEEKKEEILEEKEVKEVKKEDLSINTIIDIDKLTDNEIEAMFGGWAVEDKEALMIHLLRCHKGGEN